MNFSYPLPWCTGGDHPSVFSTGWFVLSSAVQGVPPTVMVLKAGWVVFVVCFLSVGLLMVVVTLPV